MYTAFISDLHLLPNNCPTTKIFIKYLEKNSNDIEKLYILGDLFNYWIGDDIHLGEYSEVIKAINRFNTPEKRVYLMYGNRDFLYGEEFFEKTKIQKIDDPFITKINDQNVLLTHGDLMFDRTTKYQIYRRTCLFLNNIHLIRNLFFKLSKNIRVKIANYLRKQSENYEHFTIDLKENDFFVNKMTTNNIDILIHGHTHIPSIQLINNSGKYLTRYTLSDWHGFGNVLIVQHNMPIKILFF